MSKSWKENKIKEIANVIGGGTPSSKVQEYWNGNINWITPADLSGYKYKYIYQGGRKITELGLNKSSAKLHPKNTVLMTSRAPIGYLAIAKDELATNQGFQSLRCNPDIAFFEFVYYLLKTHSEGIKSIASGATFPEVSGSKFKEYKILLPPLPTQRKIASILSAYDDLIENNLKRIKLLEEKAQLTYEEWFVKMRFPGYENTKFNEATGLPEGWEKVKLKEVAEFKYGKMPKKENLSNSGFPVYSGYRITGFTDQYLFEKPTLIVVARGVGGTGDVKISPEKCWLTNLSIAIIVKKSIYQNYLYYFLKDSNLRSLDSGAAQSQITIANLENFIVIKSSIKLQKLFNDFATLIFKQTNNISKQNLLLKEARDILLPRLMSGMIDVEQLKTETIIV